MSVELFVSEQIIVKPGQNLCKEIDSLILKEGVQLSGGYLKSTKLGKVKIIQTNGKTEISVHSILQNQNFVTQKTTSMKINDLIIGRVIKIHEFSAKIVILSINDRPVAHKYIATLKRENMRNFDIDSIDLEQILSPNNVILARIKSLNESKNILLSIEEDNLGVIFAYSENRNQLLPVSRDRMQSPVSKKEVWKKVACLKKEE